MAARNMAIPYAKMHKDVAEALQETDSAKAELKIAQAQNSGIARICGAALMMSEIVRTLSEAANDESMYRMNMLAMALDTMIHREVNGQDRAAGNREFMKHVKTSAGSQYYDRLIPKVA